MLEALIIEDEERDAELLKAHLLRYAGERGLELDVVWRRQAGDIVLADRTFDVVFLDIELPGIDGMEAASLMRSFDTATPIVFVTNLARYAVRGYEVGALDFLVKPVSYRDFTLHMSRIERSLRSASNRPVVVSTRGETRIVPMSDILRVDVKAHRVTWHLATGEAVEVRGSLAQAEESLSDGPFVRVSKDCVVNMSHIRSVHGGVVMLDDGFGVTITRGRRHDALARIASYLGRLA